MFCGCVLDDVLDREDAFFFAGDKDDDTLRRLVARNVDDRPVDMVIMLFPQWTESGAERDRVLSMFPAASRDGVLTALYHR